MIRICSTRAPVGSLLASGARPTSSSGARRPEAPCGHAGSGGGASGSAPAALARGRGTDDAARAQARPDAAPDPAIEHWDDLFGAVTARLRLSVAEPADARPEPRVRVAQGGVRTVVLDCVQALDQLQVTLRHELARRQRHARPHAHRERSDREPRAVLLVGLDGVDAIDAAHGPGVGDELLRIAAARLTQSVRAGDVVNRVGRDRLACLLAHAPGRAALTQLACRLFDTVSAPYQTATLRLTLHASIGIAPGGVGEGEEEGSAEAWLSHANTAMDRARRQHTGFAFFDTGVGPQPRGPFA